MIQVFGAGCELRGRAIFCYQGSVSSYVDEVGGWCVWGGLPPNRDVLQTMASVLFFSDTAWFPGTPTDRPLRLIASIPERGNHLATVSNNVIVILEEIRRCRSRECPPGVLDPLRCSS